jgi:hypothetical protein
MLPILFTVRSLLRRRLPAGGEAGQTSAEYALVLLGAAMVAMLVVAWARSTGKVGDLLDGIIEDIIDTAT